MLGIREADFSKLTAERQGKIDKSSIGTLKEVDTEKVDSIIEPIVRKIQEEDKLLASARSDSSLESGSLDGFKYCEVSTGSSAVETTKKKEKRGRPKKKKVRICLLRIP